MALLTDSSSDPVDSIAAKRIAINGFKHRTAAAVKACYRHYVEPDSSPERLLGLCMLPWLSAHRTNKPRYDNTKAVLSPAFSALTGADIDVKKITGLRPALETASVPRKIVDLVCHDPAAAPGSAPRTSGVGFVNFRGTYRKRVRVWLEQNAAAVANILQRVVVAKSNSDLRSIYEEVERLPRIDTEGGTKSTSATHVLSPVIACLHPRLRAPVINSQDGVEHKLKELGLAKAPLADQMEAMVGLIRQYGVKDALDLDTELDRSDSLVAAKQPAKPQRRTPAHKTNGAASNTVFGDGDDHDIEMLRAQKMSTMRRIHRRMEKALAGVLSAAGLKGIPGAPGDFQFDVLIPGYCAPRRDLLVEIKSDCEVASCRLAVGQLYHYRLSPQVRRKDTDLAILFPEKPHKRILTYLDSLDIRPLWFTQPDFAGASLQTIPA